MKGWLWFLTFLFLIRVVAQPLTAIFSIPGLPPFEAFQSGLVPYPLLLLSQVTILGIMTATAVNASTGRLAPRPRLAHALATAGWIYAAAMLARLFIGAFLLGESAFFARPVPTFFHLVLASFLILCSRLYRTGDLPRSSRAVR
jgi:hypothetical protein